MAAEPMEIRMARLEGAYTQVDRRLDALHGDMVELRKEFRSEFVGLRGELAALREGVDRRFENVDRKFMWLAGIVVGTWITTILTILFHR